MYISGLVFAIHIPRHQQSVKPQWTCISRHLDKYFAPSEIRSENLCVRDPSVSRSGNVMRNLLTKHENVSLAWQRKDAVCLTWLSKLKVAILTACALLCFNRIVHDVQTIITAYFRRLNSRCKTGERCLEVDLIITALWMVAPFPPSCMSMVLLVTWSHREEVRTLIRPLSQHQRKFNSI